ncbi:MAG: hypothetical protein MUF13_06900, partial [Akkermansiaceae bacterium]|nr:hypothetical protein [Akkermansiaceae bacterium]
MDEERKRGWSFGMWLLLAVVAFLLVAVVLQRRTYERAHRYDRRETVNNARQIGIALFEFEVDFGR